VAAGSAAFIVPILPARLAELSALRDGRNLSMVHTQGIRIYVAGIIVTALASGLLWWRPSSWLVSFLLNGPALILAPFVMPRGDNDGLWGLIYPMIGVIALASLFAHTAGHGIRHAVDCAREQAGEQARRD
jgi:hypothetical protein